MSDVEEPVRQRTLHLHLSPLERTRLWVEILAFVAAGVWGVYVFVYQTSIAPLFQTAHEVVTADLTTIATVPTGRVERVQLTLHNIGNIAIDNAAFVVNLYGLTDIGSAAESTAMRGNLLVRASSGIPDHWRLIGSYGELFSAAQGGLKGSHLILNPGDSVDLAYPAVIPRGKYLAVKLSAEIEFVRMPYRRGIPLQLVRRANGAYALHVVTGPHAGDNGSGVSNDWYFPT